MRENGEKDRATRQIEFSEEAYEALEKLAQDRGVSVTEVLRDALSHEQWLDELRKTNARVLVERDGEQRELVLN
jgi:predicted CopG family antitoxin